MYLEASVFLCEFILTSASFFFLLLYYLNSHVMRRARGEVSFGDTWERHTRLTKKKKNHMKERMSNWERNRGESALFAVQYNLDLWFLSHGHVANFPTDGIHFLYFTFPWTLCFTPTLSGSRSASPFIFSSSRDKGGTSPTLTVKMRLPHTEQLLCIILTWDWKKYCLERQACNSAVGKSAHRMAIN